MIHGTNMRAYETAFRVLDRMDPSRYHIVDYREIAAAPKATMAAIYDALGIPMTPEYEKILEEVQERARLHQSGHAYGLEEYGLTDAGIRADAPTVFQRYRFD